MDTTLEKRGTYKLNQLSIGDRFYFITDNKRLVYILTECKVNVWKHKGKTHKLEKTICVLKEQPWSNKEVSSTSTVIFLNHKEQ
jgi:hypothetical protein